MKIKEYADHRHVSRNTVFSWIKLGLPVVRQSKRNIIINVDAADVWLDTHLNCSARKVKAKRSSKNSLTNVQVKKDQIDLETVQKGVKIDSC